MLDKAYHVAESYTFFYNGGRIVVGKKAGDYVRHFVAARFVKPEG